MDTSDPNNEYTLKDIAEVWKSDDVITPYNLPRNTQNSLGKYVIRTDGKYDYPNQKVYVHPKCLDNYTKAHRHFWVIAPGIDDYFVHYMHKKYSFKIADYNPRNSHSKLLIPRPYTCDFEYINGVKLSGIINITDKYHLCNPDELEKIAKNIPKQYGCASLAPFWYPEMQKAIREEIKMEIKRKIEKTPLQRWKPAPNYLLHATQTAAQRKAQLSLVGQPFLHEACTFYNEHYPAAKLSIFKYKFC